MVEKEINILTWNIQSTGAEPKAEKQGYRISDKRLKGRFILDAAIENEIDIIVFQEAYGIYLNTLLGNIYYEIKYPDNSLGSGVRIFLKAGEFDEPLEVFTGEKLGNKLVFLYLRRTNGGEIFNLAAIHLHSKVGNTERQQLWKNNPIFNEIREIENKLANVSFYRTIMVGDFNQNPYENDLNDRFMVNAERDRNLIEIFKDNNPVYKTERFDFNFWYNPMWNFVGDYDTKNNDYRVTGTYFRYTEDESTMWNLIDGFIVRPYFMRRIIYDKSKIIVGTNSVSFLKTVITSKKESLIPDDISDHLPVKFTFLIN